MAKTEEKKADGNKKSPEELIEALDNKLTELETRLETAESEKGLYEEQVEELQSMLREYQDMTGEEIEPEAEILYDPFYSKNPFKIIGEIPPNEEAPGGQILAWKNPKHRQERRGWRGWIPLEYGDKYTGDNGELLSNYIPDVPPRLEGSSKVDNYVRRADCVLCRIKKEWFEARQQQRMIDSQRNVKREGSSKTIELGEGIRVVGPGLREQKRPSGGFKRGEKPIVGPHHQRLPVTEKG
jgi:hypothetical protein